MVGCLKACGYGLLGALPAACSEPDCTLILVSGVVVQIRDEVNGTPLAETARGVVQDGAYTDSLQLFAPGAGALARSAAYERPGVYTVIVEHQGFAPWRREHVRVRGGDCHVQTAHLAADLERTP